MRGFLLLAMVLLAACSGQESTPEQRVKALIEQGELAAEERRIGFFADHVADDYQGEGGEDRRALMRLLRGYFLSHQSVHVVMKADSIRHEGQRVHAVIFAGLAGSPVQGFEQLMAIRAGLYRFELTFTADEEPRLLNAAWRRANMDEVLPQL